MKMHRSEQGVRRLLQPQTPEYIHRDEGLLGKELKSLGKLRLQNLMSIESAISLFLEVSISVLKTFRHRR